MTTRNAAKSGPAGFRKRLQVLVNEAGSQSALARAVWGDAAAYKGKVNKWYNGAAISAREAKAIADTFGRRAGWLMWGELPEREGVARPETDLALDLAAYIANEIPPRVRNERFWKYFVTYWQIDGRVALRLAVDREVERFKKAIGGLDEFEQRAREALEEKADYLGDMAGAPRLSREKGESQPDFDERRRLRQRQLSAIVWELVNTARLAEFASQLRQPEPTALVFVPPGKKGPHHGEQRQQVN